MTRFGKLLCSLGFCFLLASLLVNILPGIGHTPQALADDAPTFSRNENGGGGGGGHGGGGHGRSSPAQRIRSYSGESWFEGPNFAFATETGPGIHGFIITDLIFSFFDAEENYIHQALVIVDGAMVFRCVREFRQSDTEPTSIHLESGISIPPGVAVQVIYRTGNPSYQAQTIISGYNF